MTKEEINSILKKYSKPASTAFCFSIKNRNDIKGYFVDTMDHLHLNSKNYWHIVKFEKKDEWLETRNHDLLWLFNGDSFLKIKVI